MYSSIFDRYLQYPPFLERVYQVFQSKGRELPIGLKYNFKATSKQLSTAKLSLHTVSKQKFMPPSPLKCFSFWYKIDSNNINQPSQNFKGSVSRQQPVKPAKHAKNLKARQPTYLIITKTEVVHVIVLSAG